MFRAEFHDRVKVDYPVVNKDTGAVDHGYVEGADVLALAFQWDANYRRRAAPGVEQDREAQRDRLVAQVTTRPATSHPATSIATTFSSSGPAASSPAIGTAEGSAAATSQPTSAPAPRRARAGDPMVITWSGPLILAPCGYTDDPSSKTYEITADGERIVLGDSKTVASCRHFRYASPEQEGELDGNDDQPARLILSDGSDVVCSRFDYQRDHNLAFLDGAGYMTTHQGVPFEELQMLAWLPAAAAPEANSDSIRWSRSVEVTFGADARPGGAGGAASIQEANFVGDVRLLQPSTGDSFRSDSLLAILGRDESNRPAIRKVIASGNVRGLQQGTQITADKVTVPFGPAASPRDSAVASPASVATATGPSPTTGPATATGPARQGEAERSLALATSAPSPGRRDATRFGRLQPVALQAEGNVVVMDGSGPDMTLARADRLDSNLLDRSAVLWGAPAWITHGQDQMAGREIHLREVPDPNGQDKRFPLAVVDGPGTLVFLIRRDLNGTELKTPRPVKIAWTRSMDYSALRGNALFDGNVQLVSAAATAEESGVDFMSCRKMQVIFDKTPPPASRAGASSRPTATRPSRPASGPAEPGLTEVTSLEALADQATSGPASMPAGGGSAAGRANRRPALTMQGYSGQRVARIIGTGDVKMFSNRLDPNGCLTRRLSVIALGPDGELLYDPNKVQVAGMGTMVAEDYRAPEPNRAGRASSQPIEGMDRPQKTTFWWDRSMQLTQKDRKVELEGNVAMRHVSGLYVQAPGEKTPPWPALKGGRVTTLRCDQLQAFFSEAQGGPTAASTGGMALEGGPRIGQPTQILAVGDVDLDDGVRQKRHITGQQLEYRRTPEVFTIWGHRTDQPKAAALMTLKDLDANTYREWSSPHIVWNVTTGRIETDEGTGTGGR